MLPSRLHAIASDTAPPSSSSLRHERVAARSIAAMRWLHSFLQHMQQPEKKDQLTGPTDLLASVSHDLLTPITRMKLRAELISIHSLKQKFIADLDEVEGLARSVLAYTASSHGMPDEWTEIELASFLTAMVHDYQDTGKAVIAKDPLAGVVMTRPRLLRRALTNLVDNALKFAGEAVIATDIRERNSLCIHVLDRGPGIPDQHLRAVIQPFVRIACGRNPVHGVGLGLSTVQNLTFRLNGSLSLRNRDGGGLEAELQLPRYIAPHSRGTDDGRRGGCVALSN